MASYYDEVEVHLSHSAMNESKLITKQIEDMEFDEENLLFHSPCPCGDRFEISLVSSNLVVFHLPVTTCSLIIRVIYDLVINSARRGVLTEKDDFVEDEKGEEKETKPLTAEIAA